ncbi:17884_t:CDS:1, partial [Racocetra fulgida]
VYSGIRISVAENRIYIYTIDEELGHELLSLPQVRPYRHLIVIQQVDLAL